MSSGKDPKIIGEQPETYAGDVTPREAWRVLSENEEALLVDVRTVAEWAFVGIPDLESLGRTPLFVEWQTFPDNARNPKFLDELEQELTQIKASKDAPILFLCRSGQRSRAAAITLANRGYVACHNVACGFEGNLGNDKHRSETDGWKVSGLPWKQS